MSRKIDGGYPPLRIDLTNPPRDPFANWPAPKPRAGPPDYFTSLAPFAQAPGWPNGFTVWMVAHFDFSKEAKS